MDDHRVFAEAISLAIDAEDDLRCVATVGLLADALDVLERVCPCVVLLDLELPDGDGLDVVSDCRDLCSDLRVIVLTANTSATTLLRAVEVGVDAFLPKEQRFSDVLDAVRDIDAPVLGRQSIGALLRAALQHSGPDAGQQAPELTEREQEVLLLLAEGQPVKRIARTLDMSVNTCRGHIRSLLAKLDVHTQLQAVVRAARLGMLPNLRGAGGR